MKHCETPGVIAEDLTVCINPPLKTHPGKSLKQHCSLVTPAKALAFPCLQDYQKHSLTSRKVMAKSTQGHTNGSIALKHVADSIYYYSPCNAVMGKGRCIPAVLSLSEKKLMSSHVKRS